MIDFKVYVTINEERKCLKKAEGDIGDGVVLQIRLILLQELNLEEISEHL